MFDRGWLVQWFSRSKFFDRHELLTYRTIFKMNSQLNDSYFYQTVSSDAITSRRQIHKENCRIYQMLVMYSFVNYSIIVVNVDLLYSISSIQSSLSQSHPPFVASDHIIGRRNLLLLSSSVYYYHRQILHSIRITCESRLYWKIHDNEKLIKRNINQNRPHKINQQYFY